MIISPTSFHLDIQYRHCTKLCCVLECRIFLGRAGIYLLLQNPRQAIEEYRKVLQISADFTPEKAKTPLSIDKLQLIHTMHNLAEVIVTCTDVGDTLRDHRLKEDCAALQDEYLQKYIKQVSDIASLLNYTTDI